MSDTKKPGLDGVPEAGKEAASMTITSERIAELRRLCSEATEGPWEAVSKQMCGLGLIKNLEHCSYATVTDAEGNELISECWGDGEQVYFGYLMPADAAFIAASCAALPELLDEVERLRRAEGLLERWVGLDPCEDCIPRVERCRFCDYKSLPSDTKAALAGEVPHEQRD